MAKKKTSKNIEQPTLCPDDGQKMELVRRETEERSDYHIVTEWFICPEGCRYKKQIDSLEKKTVIVWEKGSNRKRQPRKKRIKKPAG